jgi:hypothetical protein
LNTLKADRRRVHDENQHKKSRRKFWIGAFCVIGIISFIYVFKYLQTTLIAYTVPLLCSAVFGLVAAALLVKKMVDFWYYFAFSASIFIAVPLFVNSLFASSKAQVFKERIRAKHHSHSRSGPFVEIEFGDLSRYIHVTDNEQVDTSSFVILTTNKGLFGYYVIRDSKLVKN